MPITIDHEVYRFRLRCLEPMRLPPPVRPSGPVLRQRRTPFDRGLLEASRQIPTARSRLRWHDWTRYSNRQETTMQLGGLVGELAFAGDLAPFAPWLAWAEAAEDWDERLEPLIERVEVDGTPYLELSPTGQIFHETFAGRFRSHKDRVLPAAVPPAQKRTPRLNDHSWGNARGPILRHPERVTHECPYVRGCGSTYWNPDLGEVSCFRLRCGEIKGVWSDGSWTVKFRVDTSAATEGQVEACLADLNGRLEGWG